MPRESDDIDLGARKPAAVALLTIGCLSLGLPASVVVGPSWLELVIISVLLVPTTLTRRRGSHRANAILAFVVYAIVTLFMVLSLALASRAVLQHLETSATLLRLAVLLWFTNILVFACWYWRFDAGGPRVRAALYGHRRGSFLFPQMTLNPTQLESQGMADWSPEFVDYLFLAFNTSTALSPTDTPVLARWAKVLMMIQATISLSIIAFLGARAVGIL